MTKRRTNITKYEILQVASEFFLEKGYSNTSPKMIADQLGLSTGNITYYFPTKEHLLEIIVQMLCEFQWKLIGDEVDRGIGSVASICLELMTVAAACEESEIARDFFVSTFQSEMCRNYLCTDHVRRAEKIFGQQCPDWTHEQFLEAEILVMGMQYATIVSVNAPVSLKTRIAGALHQILSIYNIDEQTRQAEIDKVLSLDVRGLGKRVLEEFVNYVESTNETLLEELVQKNKQKIR